MSLGVVRAIRDLGLTIPGDVSLVAHDDVFNAQTCQYRFGDQADHVKAIVADIAGVIDQQQHGNAKL